MGLPITEDFGPFWINDAFISICLIEMLMGSVVGGVHDVSCPPDNNDATEETDQAYAVENCHEVLALLSVTL